MANIATSIESRLPQDLLDLVKDAGRLAVEHGQSLYLVGGTVRDLLLGRPNLDLDLALEGDAPALARRLARLTGASVKSHPRFGTATVRWGNSALDVVTARSETYARPAALPSVKPGTIEDDLRRRDFTINAMAASLAPPHFGDLVDPHDGKTDLDRGIVRVLHGNSFRDDPTRIWRAIRYEQRLGFRLGHDTEGALRRDVGLMHALSGDRLRHEIERILHEERPERAFHRAWQLNALQQVSPNLAGDTWLARRFEHARLSRFGSGPDGTLYLALLAWRLDATAIEAFIGRLKFGREVARVLRDIVLLKDALPKLEAADLLPSEICHLLDPRRLQTIEAATIAADRQSLRERLEHYLADLRSVRPALDGDDLARMGLPPGRKTGRILHELRDARLNGTVKTPEEETGLVRRWLAERGP